MKKAIFSNKFIDLILEAAESKKALNPVVLDIKRSGRIADYMVIVSGESAPQLKAIVREIDARVKKTGTKGIVWDGQVDSGWLIFDLGSILVHVMSEEERAFYNLEGLWGKEATVYY